MEVLRFDCQERNIKSIICVCQKILSWSWVDLGWLVQNADALLIELAGPGIQSPQISCIMILPFPVSCSLDCFLSSMVFYIFHGLCNKVQQLMIACTLLPKHTFTVRVLTRCDGSDDTAEESGLKDPGFKPWPRQKIIEFLTLAFGRLIWKL